MTSNAAKCSRSCAGVTIPAWCSPWKGYAAGASAAAGSSARRDGEPADPGAHAEGPDAGGAEQPASRQGARAPCSCRRSSRHSVRAPVIFDSGSESASTALASCLRWASSTVS